MVKEVDGDVLERWQRVRGYLMGWRMKGVSNRL